MSAYSGISRPRKRAESLLTTEREILRKVIQDAPLEEVLNIIAHGLEELFPETRAVVMLLDETGERLWIRSAPGLPADLAHALDGIAPGPAGGPCGTAAWRGAPVIVEDIHAAPAPPEIHALTARHGLSSSASYPITAGSGRALGTLTMLAGGGRPWGDDSLSVMAAMSNLAAAAIQKTRSQAALQETAGRLHRVLEGSNDGFWDWNIQAGEVHFSERWAAMLGYRLEELPPRVDTWTDLLHPADKPQVMRALESHLAGETPLYEVEQRLLAKSGEWKWILDRGKVTARDADGKPLRASGTHTDITERKRIEEKLRDSEELHRSLFETSPDGIAVAATSGAVRFVSPATARMFGYRSAEMAGLHVLHFVVPDDRARATEQFTRLCAGETTGPEEYRGVHTDGHTFPIEVNGRLLRAAGGEAAGVLLICRDVSVRKVMEEVLRLQRERLALHAERTPLAYIEFDSESRITFWNSAAERIFGFSRQEALGRVGTELLLPAENRAEVAGVLDRLHGGSDAYRSTNPNITRDGRRILCDWYNTALVDSGGMTIGFASLAQDITEQARDRERLAFQAQIMAQIGEPVIGADREANITSWNRAAEALYGWRAADAVGRPFEAVVPVLESPATREEVVAILNSGAAWEGDVVHQDRAGDRIPVHVVATPFRNAEKAVVGFVLVVRDLRSRRRAEQLAMRSSRLESTATLAGGIAHDFNNLMTVVVGQAELLRMRLADRPERVPP